MQEKKSRKNLELKSDETRAKQFLTSVILRYTGWITSTPYDFIPAPKPKRQKSNICADRFKLQPQQGNIILGFGIVAEIH